MPRWMTRAAATEFCGLDPIDHEAAGAVKLAHGAAKRRGRIWCGSRRVQRWANLFSQLLPKVNE